MLLIITHSYTSTIISTITTTAVDTSDIIIITTTNGTSEIIIIIKIVFVEIKLYFSFVLNGKSLIPLLSQKAQLCPVYAVFAVCIERCP
jgi:hypothetical protein